MAHINTWLDEPVRNCWVWRNAVSEMLLEKGRMAGRVPAPNKLLKRESKFTEKGRKKVRKQQYGKKNMNYVGIL